MNLEHGPIPSVIKNLVDQLSSEPDQSELSDTIIIDHVEWQSGTMQKMKPTRAMRDSEMQYFSDDELKTLQEVCNRFGAMNTKQIEDSSHREAAWSTTTFLEDIPYSLAGRDSDSHFTEQDIADRMSLLSNIYAIR